MVFSVYLDAIINMASRGKRKAQCVTCFYFPLIESIHNYLQGHGFPGANLKQKFMTVTSTAKQRVVSII